MVKIVSVDAVRKIEAEADAGGLSYATLMEHAGRAVAARVLRALSERAPAEQPRVTVLVGPGNNGGDGLVAARIVASESNALVRVYLLKPRAEDDANYAAVRYAGLLVANADDDQRYRVLTNMIASAHVVVDALFGVGVRLPLEGNTQKLLTHVHTALGSTQPEDTTALLIHPGETTAQTLRPPRPYVIAVDVPSGLNADTGDVDKQTLTADETVTFIAAKPGHFLFPGAAAVGTLLVAPIGIDESAGRLKDEPRRLMTAADARSHLPGRGPGSHKGTFGKALVVAGSVNYTGAPSLSAEACYRVGAGRVTVATPSPVAAALSGHMREATWILLPHDMGVIAFSAANLLREELSRFSAVLLGPGLGREATTGQMLGDLLGGQPTHVRKPRSIGFGPPLQTSERGAEPSVLPPLVIDADGLFLLSQLDAWWTQLPAATVLTPHPGEMAQLTGLTVQEVEADRWALAAQKAAEWHAVVVLKGAHTVIAAPDGRLTVLPFKTSALAKAGTGDVLAGMITGLIAQGLGSYEAACTAAYLHGLAGKLGEDELGTRATLAGDVVSFLLPQALALLDPCD